MASASTLKIFCPLRSWLSSPRFWLSSCGLSSLPPLPLASTSAPGWAFCVLCWWRGVCECWRSSLCSVRAGLTSVSVFTGSSSAAGRAGSSSSFLPFNSGSIGLRVRGFLALSFVLPVSSCASGLRAWASRIFRIRSCFSSFSEALIFSF